MKHLKLFFLAILSLQLWVQCSTENTTEINDSKFILDDEDISFKEKFAFLTKDKKNSSIEFSQNHLENLNSLYSLNSFTPLFYKDTNLNNLGTQLREVLQNPLLFGLAPFRFLALNDRMHWVEKELILATNFTTMLGDLNQGFIDFDSVRFKPINRLDLDSLFFSSLKPDSIELTKILLSQGPSDTNYRYLANNLFDFCKKYPLDSSTFQLKSKKADTLNYESNLYRALSSKGFTADSSSSEVKRALVNFKQSCGFEKSSIVTEAVLTALSESTENKIIRASITLDKLRQIKKKEKKHVRVNLPSFMLYFVAEDQIQSTHRVIIGKQKTQTPEFTANINTIVSYPYWKVPHSISDNEILPAVRKNKEYLKKHNYRIYQNDIEIDPTTVDFSKYYKRFPFTTIQDPGPENSLGLLKILFYNEHGVYVHDTPSRSLFKRDYRSFSHGCMRCEKPIELAKRILDFDSIRPKNRNDITRDSLDFFIENKMHRKIKLKKSFPIYIEYNTVTADKQNIYFHNDLYARESKLIELFKKR